MLLFYNYLVKPFTLCVKYFVLYRIGRKEISKAEQLINRALKLDPDNNEARDALKELQTNGSFSTNKDAGLVC